MTQDRPPGTGTGTVELHRQADWLLVRAARRARGWVAVLALAEVVSAGASLALPAGLAAAVDAVLGRAALAGSLARFGALLAVVTLADAAVELADAYCMATATAWLRRGLLRRALELGLPGQRRFAAGDLVSRVVGSTADAASGASAGMHSVVSIAMAIGGVVALGLIDWHLAATFLLGIPLGLALLNAFVRQTSSLNARYQEVLGAISGRLVEALAGVRTIRAAGTHRREIERILRPLPRLAEHGSAIWRSYGQVVWRGSLLAPLIMIAVLGVAGHGVAVGRVSPGQMTATIGYVALGLGLFGQSNVLMRLGLARAGARRVAEVSLEPSIPVGTRDLPPGPGNLVLRGVTVRGDAALLLDRLDLVVPAGTALAVVGFSGAGKSTLAAVAGRLIDPDEGEVLLDGVPLAALRPEVLRAEVAYGFERPALFGETVADAIDWRGDRAAERGAVGAARVAHAHDFIRRLPAGYATPLREAPMSGGETQRLGLARAVAQGGRLLILDDATSSLDTVTEVQVSQALATARAGCTSIVIAHRVRTAARADLVAWLEGGRVRAVAPHSALWSDPGYRRTFQTGQPTIEEEARLCPVTD